MSLQIITLSVGGKPNLKVYILYDPIYSILEMTKLYKRKTDLWLSGVRDGKWICQKKGNMRDPCSNGTVLYLDCIHANILVMMLHYRFEDVIARETG